MNPDPMMAGVVLFGTNPPSVDAAAAWVMGFDPARIPLVRQAFACRHLPLATGRWEDVVLHAAQDGWSGPLGSLLATRSLAFAPHFGWAGHVERALEARDVGA